MCMLYKVSDLNVFSSSLVLTVYSLMEHRPSTKSSQAFLSFANFYNSLHVLPYYSPVSGYSFLHVFSFPPFLLLCRFQWKDFIVILLTGFLNVCPASVSIVSTPPDSMKCVYSPQWQALHYWCSHSMCVRWWQCVLAGCTTLTSGSICPQGIRQLSVSHTWLAQAQTAAEPLTIATQDKGIRTICLNDPRKRYFHKTKLHYLHYYHWCQSKECTLAAVDKVSRPVWASRWVFKWLMPSLI